MTVCSIVLVQIEDFLLASKDLIRVLLTSWYAPLPVGLGYSTFMSKQKISRRAPMGAEATTNLLLLDWKLWNIPGGSISLMPQTPPYRLCWDKDALADPIVAAKYSSALSPNLFSWNNASFDLLNRAPHVLASLDTGSRQVLIDGMYASWSFLVHDALCNAVPVKAVGKRSKEWWNPDLQKLLDKRNAAHASLTAYCNTLQYDTNEPFLADFAWQELGSTYAQLRKEAHELIQSNKADKWQHLVSKVESEFDTDKRFFFATIQRIRSVRSGKKASSIPSLRVLLTSTVPNPGSITSDREKIKHFFLKSSQSTTLLCRI
jgi:hypothetical protein